MRTRKRAKKDDGDEALARMLQNQEYYRAGIAMHTFEEVRQQQAYRRLAKKQRSLEEPVIKFGQPILKLPSSSEEKHEIVILANATEESALVSTLSQTISESPLPHESLPWSRVAAFATADLFTDGSRPHTGTEVLALMEEEKDADVYRFYKPAILSTYTARTATVKLSSEPTETKDEQGDIANREKKIWETKIDNFDQLKPKFKNKDATGDLMNGEKIEGRAVHETENLLNRENNDGENIADTTNLLSRKKIEADIKDGTGDQIGKHSREAINKPGGDLPNGGKNDGETKGATTGLSKIRQNTKDETGHLMNLEKDDDETDDETDLLKLKRRIRIVSGSSGKVPTILCARPEPMSKRKDLKALIQAVSQAALIASQPKTKPKKRARVKKETTAAAKSQRRIAVAAEVKAINIKIIKDPFQLGLVRHPNLLSPEEMGSVRQVCVDLHRKAMGKADPEEKGSSGESRARTRSTQRKDGAVAVSIADKEGNGFQIYVTEDGTAPNWNKNQSIPARWIDRVNAPIVWLADGDDGQNSSDPNSPPLGDAHSTHSLPKAVGGRCSVKYCNTVTHGGAYCKVLHYLVSGYTEREKK